MLRNILRVGVGNPVTLVREVALSQESGQHPFPKLIITLQAKEAQAFAAEASGNAADTVAKLSVLTKSFHEYTPPHTEIAPIGPPPLKFIFQQGSREHHATNGERDRGGSLQATPAANDIQARVR